MSELTRIWEHVFAQAYVYLWGLPWDDKVQRACEMADAAIRDLEKWRTLKLAEIDPAKEPTR